jgi:chaperonin cofactor prefoldin
LEHASPWNGKESMEKRRNTTILICLILLGIGFILAIRENNNNMHEIKTSVSAKEQRLDRLETQMNEIEARLGRLEQRLPQATH